MTSLSAVRLFYGFSFLLGQRPKSSLDPALSGLAISCLLHSSVLPVTSFPSAWSSPPYPHFPIFLSLHLANDLHSSAQMSLSWEIFPQGWVQPANYVFPCFLFIVLITVHNHKLSCVMICLPLSPEISLLEGRDGAPFADSCILSPLHIAWLMDDTQRSVGWVKTRIYCVR